MLISAVLLLSHLSISRISSRSVTCSRVGESAHSFGPFYKRLDSKKASWNTSDSFLLFFAGYRPKYSSPLKNWLAVLNGLIFSASDHAWWNAVKKKISESEVNPDPQLVFICPKHLQCSSKTLMSQLSFVETVEKKILVQRQTHHFSTAPLRLQLQQKQLVICFFFFSFLQQTYVKLSVNKKSLMLYWEYFP